MYSDDRSKALRLRPTLIIGAGGTGYETAVRVKARFAESFPPELLQQIRYIVFDTDTNHPPTRNSLGEMIYLDDGIELFQIGGVPVKGIIENQHNYPEIAAELELKKLPRLDLTKGAKQVRQLGRLALFYHFQRIRKVLETALRDVLNIGHYTGTTPPVQAINCFFIGSACGGTGSGILIDLAYLTRQLAHKWGIPIDYIHTTCLLVLPEAFTKIPASNEAQIRANASAMLSEIDHFMVHGDFDVMYPDKFHVVDPRPPFNITYLMDASNERNHTVADLNQLTPIMAESIFLQAGSFLGAQVDSAFDNIPTSTSQDINGHLRGYSMVGASTLHFNAQRVSADCAYRLIDDLVYQLFLKQVDQQESRRRDEKIHPQLYDQVQGFFGKTNLSIDLLKQQLRKSDGAEQLVVTLNTEMFDRLEPQVMVRRVESACTRYAQETIIGRFLPQISLNQRRMSDEMTHLLSEHVDAIVDGVESGIPLAHLFLQGVGESLIPLRQQLQQEREQIKQQIGRSQAEIDRAMERLETASQAFTFWGLMQQSLRQARQRYGEAQRRYLQKLVEQGVANHALALLEMIEARIQRLGGLLTTLQAMLEKVANEARRERENLRANWRPQHVTEENLDSPDDTDRYYKRYLHESILYEGRALVVDRPLSHWLFALEANSGEGVEVQELHKEWLHQFAFGRFQRLILDETVEKQLSDLYPNERDRRSRLQLLIDLASPFTNYETTSSGQGSEDLDQILVVGVHDKNRSIFAETPLPKATLVSTFDPHRISVLHTKHGLPLHALRQYSEYRRHFANQQARSQAGSLPMFGFKVAQQEAKVQSWYAQGEAFGIIIRKGSLGYLFRTGDGEILLGTTLKEALEKLVSQPSWHDLLWKALLYWQEQHDHYQAMQALEEYTQAARRNPFSLHDELCLVAKSEWDRHQRLSRM